MLQHATTLIYVRSYKPISVTFPPPGLYQGRVHIILPDLDPTILSRLNEGGAGQAYVELSLETPTPARDILGWLERNAHELEKLSRGVASPILPRFLTHMRRTKSPSRIENQNARLPLVPPENPLESIQDEN